MYEDLLRRFFDFDEYYEEDALRALAGLSPNEPVADAYLHRADCK